MKAIIFTEYGSPEVLTLAQVDQPIPNKNEVLIKVHATTATSAESMMRRGDSFMTRLILGIRKPKKKYQILGLELSGTVVGMGSKVNKFQIGDEVFGFTGFTPGAYGEYICLDQEASIINKPAELNHKEAATIVDGSTTAYHFLHSTAHIQPQQKVLIIGASGSVGSGAVQIAKYFKAQVTGLCSGRNAELVLNLGADKVIDYTKDNYNDYDEKYDIIFDTVGKSSYKDATQSLKENGIYMVTTGELIKLYLRTFISNLKYKFFGGKRFIYTMSVEKMEALGFICQLIKDNDIRPVIEKSYKMEEIVEAVYHVDSGHKVGNIAVELSN